MITRMRFSHSVRNGYALVFGLFLGLCILKFGNAIILDRQILAPSNVAEAWRYGWPLHWAFWVLVLLGLAGLGVAGVAGCRRLSPAWLMAPPLIWFGWQCLSSLRTVDTALTSITLWHFGGCVACFFAGACLLGSRRACGWICSK